MIDDGDDILNAVGIALVVMVVLSVAMLVLAGMTADDRSSGKPNEEWQLERINNTAVKLVHSDSEPVRASNVVVTVNRIQRQVPWEGEVITQGDSIVLTAGEGDAVRVFYDRGYGDRTLIESWRLGQE